MKAATEIWYVKSIYMTFSGTKHLHNVIEDSCQQNSSKVKKPNSGDHILETQEL